MPNKLPLVDTNVISELAKRTPNGGVITWASTVDEISISVITLEEIIFGLSWKPNERIQHWFDNFLTNLCVVVPVSVEIAKHSGSLRGLLTQRGIQRTQADMIIAATAQVNQQTLVTRNIKDFCDCNIPVFNPFQ